MRKLEDSETAKWLISLYGVEPFSFLYCIGRSPSTRRVCVTGCPDGYTVVYSGVVNGTIPVFSMYPEATVSSKFCRYNSIENRIVRKYRTFIKFCQGLFSIIITGFLIRLQQSSSRCQKDLKLVFVTMGQQA